MRAFSWQDSLTKFCQKKFNHSGKGSILFLQDRKDTPFLVYAIMRWRLLLRWHWFIYVDQCYWFIDGVNCHCGCCRNLASFVCTWWCHFSDTFALFLLFCFSSSILAFRCYLVGRVGALGDINQHWNGIWLLGYLVDGTVVHDVLKMLTTNHPRSEESRPIFSILIHWCTWNRIKESFKTMNTFTRMKIHY